MTLNTLGRGIVWVAVVVGLILALNGPHIPRWLLAVVVAIALTWGSVATVRQKRMERGFARRLWRSRQRPTR
jgi:heme O synthase-like polyprenyltransferase